MSKQAAEVLSDEDFQAKVLKGVDDLAATQKTLATEQGEFKNRFDKVTSELDRSDKEVKKALEDLTKVKNTVNDFDKVMREMQKVQKAIARNVRSSWADPAQKALDANEGLGVFLNAAARAAAFPSETNRLPAEFRKVLEESQAAVKALTGVDTSLGQATIPTEFFKEIYDTLLEYGDYSALDVIPVGARTNSLPVGTARPMFYWVGQGSGAAESTAITEGSFTGSAITLSILTIATYLLASRELLADSSVDMAPYILNQLLQSLAFGLDTAAYIADGTADQTNAGFVGLFRAASANTNLAAPAAAGNTTVEGTQLEDWQRPMLTVSPIVLKRSPVWWMHPQIIVRAVAVRDKNGRPLFQTYTEAPMPGGIGNILGAPVKPVAVAPTANTAGSPVAVFGERKSQAVGLRQDIEMATSDDIKFAENMRAFRGLARAGVKLRTQSSSTTLKPCSVLTLAAI